MSSPGVLDSALSRGRRHLGLGQRAQLRIPLICNSHPRILYSRADPPGALTLGTPPGSPPPGRLRNGRPATLLRRHASANERDPSTRVPQLTDRLDTERAVELQKRAIV